MHCLFHNSTRLMKTTQEMSAVNVAKDVIAQIKAERLIATQGEYCIPYVDGYDLEDWVSGHRNYHLYGEEEIKNYDEVRAICNGSFQTLFQEEDVTCEVCAIGAVFVSFVNLYNEVTVDEIVMTSRGMLAKLSSVFSNTLMRTMERVFEGEWIEGSAKDARDDFYRLDCITKAFIENNTDAQSGSVYIEEQLNSMSKCLNPEETILSLMQNLIDNDGALMIPGVGLVK